MNMTSPKYSDGIKTVVQTNFGGIDKRAGARDGAIFDMLNMTSDHYPVLSTREARAPYNAYINMMTELLVDGMYELYSVCDVSDRPYCIFTHYNDPGWNIVVCMVDDEGSVKRCRLSLSEREEWRPGELHSVAFNNMLVVFAGGEAERVRYDSNKNALYSERLDSCYEDRFYVYFMALSNVRLELPIDPSLQDEYTSRFGVGDKVKVTTSDGYDGYLTVRKSVVDLSAQREYAWIVELDWADGFCFKNEDGSYPDGEMFNISIGISIPTFEHVCVNRDRIWGAVGNELYACASCDPRFWFRYDGTAADSFYAQIPDVSSFTGIASYCNSVYFFTAENVYRMYGTTPDVFSIAPLGIYGMHGTESRSVAVALGMLFYNSTQGVVSCDGDSARVIGYPLGDDMPLSAIGGGFANKYYMAFQDKMYVFNIEYSTWQLYSDNVHITDVKAFDGRVVIFEGEYATYINKKEEETTWSSDEKRQSVVEFADISEGSLWGVCPAEFAFCAWLGEGASLKLSISYEGGEWKEIHSTDKVGKHTHRVRFAPRERVDYYRLRLDGVGEWKLYSLGRSYSVNSSTPYGE